MDSQSAMLEVATGEGSSSSDSIVSLSQSGASSISTTTSTTPPNLTRSPDQSQDLLAKIHHLQEEKKLLEGRIRGYKTLSDLLLESKKENQKLKAQVMELQSQQNESSTPQAVDDTGGKDPTAQVDMTKMSLGGADNQQDVGSKPAMAAPPPIALTSSYSTGLSGIPAVFPPEISQPSSLQETASPPSLPPLDSEETKLISLPNRMVSQAKGSSGSGETTPMQESLGHINPNAPLPLNNLSSGLGGSGSGGNKSPELLQLDSDKYDEATYEKVGPRLGGNHGSLTGSMYAAAGRGMGGMLGGGGGRDVRQGDFPSLSSDLSAVMVPSSDHTGSSSMNPPYMGMMHQSYIGQASDAGGSRLAAEVETISEQLNSEPGDSSPAIAFQMHAIAERIARVEQKKENQKKLIQTLMNENHDLKKQRKYSDNSHQTELVALREMNTRLMQQLKGLTQGQGHALGPGEGQGQGLEATVPKAPSPQGDWVHVERPVHSGEMAASSEQPLVDRVRKLEQERANLQRANASWQTYTEQLNQKHQMQTNDLRSKMAMLEQDLVNCRSRLADQSKEFETNLLELKRRCAEEEQAKEEALHHQRLSQRAAQEFQDQLTEMRTQLSDTARDKQALTAELTILKARTASQETQGAGSMNEGQGSNPALEAEIAMLRQQIAVYLEDFEHEREDRTSAQQARDSAKKNAETMARMNQQLSAQIKHMQKQLKERDETVSTTLRQNEAMQRQMADYKKKLASEWDQKQRLQQALQLAQQQARQQQQQRQQRNPYLSPEIYPNQPPPMFQPQPQPQPPQRLAQPHLASAPYAQPPYYPQGRENRLGAAGAAGAGTATVSPEHLPGAWTCSSCTYVNYPGRTVCEMCGIVNSPRTQQEPYGYGPADLYPSGEHPFLMSRGNEHRGGSGGGSPVIGGGDLVTDSGLPPMGTAAN